jgi:outer membrane immunogenic protein
MKKIILSSILSAIVLFSYTQKGASQLNLGVGFSNWGVPVYLGFDHRVSNDISLGLELSYRGYSERYNGNDYNHNITTFSGNGNYHFNRVMDIPSNFDFYAGLNIGFYIWSSPNNYDGTHNSGLGLGAQVGGRYFFSKNAGLNLEFGGGNAFSCGKFGLTFKL